MNFEDVLAFLENKEKLQDLIYKLKNKGENSAQFYALKDIIISLNLHLPPPGIYQQNILQHVFKFAEPRECFENFRLVSIPWKSSIETIRLNSAPQTSFFRDVCNVEHEGKFPTFCAKYFQIFKKLFLDVDEFMAEKWDSMSHFILENSKNLHEIHLDKTVINIELCDYDSFIFNLCEKHQNTIQSLSFRAHEIVSFPKISLPYVETISLAMVASNNTQIENFKNFIENISNFVENIETIEIYDVDETQQIVEYIVQNHAEQCISSDIVGALRFLPLKHGPSLFDDILNTEYPNSVLYLGLMLEDFNNPGQDWWDNYQYRLALFPNLRGISIIDKLNPICQSMENVISTNQKKWENVVSYLQSRGIEILSSKSLLEKRKKLFKQIKWGFSFR